MNANLRSARARPSYRDPIKEHDALPAPLRIWATTAALPWSARSLRKAWARAVAATGCHEAALRRMSAAEARTLARDARQIWGKSYPFQ